MVLTRNDPCLPCGWKFGKQEIDEFCQVETAPEAPVTGHDLLLYLGAYRGCTIEDHPFGVGLVGWGFLRSFHFRNPNHQSHVVIKDHRVEKFDGEAFEVGVADGVESQIIKLIEDECADTSILPNVTVKIMAKVIEYCKSRTSSRFGKESC